MKKRFFVDLPDPDRPGEFHSDSEHFGTREEAETYCAQWGAVGGKLDLITESEDDEDDED